MTCFHGGQRKLGFPKTFLEPKAASSFPSGIFPRTESGPEHSGSFPLFPSLRPPSQPPGSQDLDPSPQALLSLLRDDYCAQACWALGPLRCSGGRILLCNGSYLTFTEWLVVWVFFQWETHKKEIPAELCGIANDVC